MDLFSGNSGVVILYFSKNLVLAIAVNAHLIFKHINIKEFKI